MIESWFFVLAMLAVLLIPGPTNALLATAAHSQGLSKTFWLIPMEWLGYAYGISFWAVFIHLADPVWPALLLILHITSVLYVFWHSVYGKLRIYNNLAKIIVIFAHVNYSSQL